MTQSTRRFKPCADTPFRKMGEEIVWLNPIASKLYNGNQTSALIYDKACSGNNEAEIVSAVLDEYQGDVELISRETREFLDLLINEGILEEVK